MQTFEFTDETPVCNHLYESSVSSTICGTVYYSGQGGSKFQVCR